MLYEYTSTLSTAPVADLLTRLLGALRAKHVQLSLDLKSSGASSFSLSATASGGIELHGSDPVALSVGAHFYLKAVNASIGWDATGGNNIDDALPLLKLPPVAPMSRTTAHCHRYYFNTCTYGYSMVWWSWERWQREVDWMALQGVNTPLAMLGTEWVWRETWMKDFGLQRSDLDDFFSGPAYLPWHWMGNLDGWGGPLSDEWIDRGNAMQHQFLRRVRDLGMTPVLPAFAGFVPSALRAKFPDAPIHTSSGWGDFRPTNYVEPTSELFTRIGTAFLKRLCAEYGCGEKWFTADLYNELKPPSVEPRYLRNVSSAVYASIASGSAHEVGKGVAITPTWVAQAWMWHDKKLPYRPPWTEGAVKAFLDGPPVGGLVMLDLYAEQSPLWNETHGFWGHPWIFSTIFNFGGRSGMYGRIPHVSRAVPLAAAANRTVGGSMVGLGAAPEAIETSPVMYDLLWETAWISAPISDPRAWTRQWAARRYATFGVTTPPQALDAWASLIDGPYGIRRVQQGPVGSLIAARPQANVNMSVECCDGRIAKDIGYDPQVVQRAWEALLASVDDADASASAAALARKPTFLHDVADFGLQALSNLALAVHADAAAAMHTSNLTTFRDAAKTFLAIVDDAELLAATQQGRLLGQWIEAARACASTSLGSMIQGLDQRMTLSTSSSSSASPVRALALADLYEHNARLLISLWGNRSDSELHEYSYRLWGGMIATFYRPRWEKWFTAVEESIATGKAFNVSEFWHHIEDWEESWTWETKVKLPTTPAGDVLRKARLVHARHFR